MAVDLCNKGFSIIPDALPGEASNALVTNLGATDQADFHQASIGRKSDSTRNRFIRRNRICWIDEDNPALAAWTRWIAELQSFLNRQLFLGLYSFESHYSLYEKGDCYRRHLDAFRGERNRIVSLVTYLNQGWQPDQGGELILYPEFQDPIQVTPAFGTLVLFLSEEIPHEVLTTSRSRLGVAGWFRVNANINNQVDPPR